jgi:ribosome-associated protein
MNRRPRPKRPESAKDMALLCAAAGLDKKAQDLLLLDVAELSGYTDYFLLASGRSTRQCAAIAENMARVMKKAGIKPLSINGLQEGGWVLLDFGDIVVHVFHQPVRDLYDLESLWSDAPKVDIVLDELPALSNLEQESKRAD